MSTKKTQQGFVSVVGAIIISAMLLFMVAASSFGSIFSRSNILDADLKARSIGAADACVDIALGQFALDPYYTSGTYSLNALDECRVGKVVSDSPNTGERTFWVQATSSDAAVTSLKVVINMNDLSVVSWEEEANF